MEDEARSVLRAALTEGAATPRNLAKTISKRFQPLGGVDFRVPSREPMRAPPKPSKR